MSTVVLAANNGEIGGGEVMLLATARALRELGLEVMVVGPAADDGVLDRADAEGVPIRRFAADRRRYARELRDWHAGRTELLWCHGLVPSLATAGRPGRIVHLHQPPRPAHRAAVAAARRRAAALLVPSQWLAARIPGAAVLPNWTEDLGFRPPGAPGVGRPRRVGYLGRHSVDKGLVVLADALTRDEAREVTLVLAGEPRFVDDEGVRRVAAALAPLGERVERIGWVAPERLLRQVDGLVVPSVAPESFGLAAAEAMAAGVPCLVSDAGALPEVVGATHPWVVPAGDPDALARALGDWAGSDPERHHSISLEQRGRWSAELSPEAALPRIRTLLAGLGGGVR